jgi:hypothetical protein
VLWTSTLYWTEKEFLKYLEESHAGFEKLIFDASHSWVHFKDIEHARRALEVLNATTNLYSVFSIKQDRGNVGSAPAASSSVAGTGSDEVGGGFTEEEGGVRMIERSCIGVVNSRSELGQVNQ